MHQYIYTNHITIPIKLALCNFYIVGLPEKIKNNIFSLCTNLYETKLPRTCKISLSHSIFVFNLLLSCSNFCLFIFFSSCTFLYGWIVRKKNVLLFHKDNLVTLTCALRAHDKVSILLKKKLNFNLL